MRAAVELPADLLAATRSPYAHVRAGAVEELGSLLDGPESAMAALARSTLEAMADDDSQRVTRTVARLLAPALPEVVESVPEPTPVVEVVESVPEPTQPPAMVATPELPEHPKPEPADAPSVVATRNEPITTLPVILRVAALALLAAVPLALFGSGDDSWNYFAVLSPFEAIGAALTVWVVARVLRTERIALPRAAGILIVVGALGTVAALGSVKFSIQRIGPMGTVLSLVVLTGAALILVSGIVCVKASAQTMVAPAPLGSIYSFGLAVLAVGLGVAALRRCLSTMTATAPCGARSAKARVPSSSSSRRLRSLRPQPASWRWDLKCAWRQACSMPSAR